MPLNTVEVFVQALAGVLFKCAQVMPMRFGCRLQGDIEEAFADGGSSIWQV
jgi:hypothetical protein